MDYHAPFPVTLYPCSGQGYKYPGHGHAFCFVSLYHGFNQGKENAREGGESSKIGFLDPLIQSI